MSLNNTVFLRGRLTKDPEMQYTPSGNALTKFTVAVDRYQGKDKEKATDFIRVTTWSNTAEYVGKYIKKGDLVHLGGYIQTGSFEKDGQKYYTTDVVANEVNSLTKREKDNVEEVFDIKDDDVPF